MAKLNAPRFLLATRRAKWPDPRNPQNKSVFARTELTTSSIELAGRVVTQSEHGVFFPRGPRIANSALVVKEAHILRALCRDKTTLARVSMRVPWPRLPTRLT